MKVNCLPVYVYKNNVLGDCTNNGISSRFNTLLVYCPEGHRTFDSDKEIPLNFCVLRERAGYIHIVPAMITETGKVAARPGWWMNGGNIAATSDSRLSEMTGHNYPLNIHDRREW